MKTIAYTFRIGSPDWAKECTPTVDAWLKRHDIELKVWDQRKPGYASLKHQVVEMLEDFVHLSIDGATNRMIYIDWDLMVAPDAPLWETPHHSMVARADHPAVHKYWDRWRKEHYRNEPGLDDWVYRQAGVWSMTPLFAKLLLNYTRVPHIEGQMEQHQWNVWLCRLTRDFDGLQIHDLPREFNTITQLETGDAWIHHVAGKDEDKPALIAAAKKRFLHHDLHTQAAEK